MTTLAPTRPEEVAEAVRSHARVVAHGGRTKAPLVAGAGGPPDAAPDGDAGRATGPVRLDLTGLTGVTEYDPDEFTFSARAGTPVAEVAALLAEHGQRMPWDPPLAEDGATLGGMLAAGLNGPVRLRWGGLRDFVLGVRFVDGTARVVRAGGRVVKNAAGFDLPRLLVGSAGRLGVVTEVTFKVFPAPRAWRTLRVACSGVADARAVMAALQGRPLELEALELEPPGALVLRVAGDEAGLAAHAERVARATERPVETLSGPGEAAYWTGLAAFRWVPAGHTLVKVPLTARRLPDLEAALARQELSRRYSVGASVAWVAWPDGRDAGELDLAGLAGLVVRGGPPARHPGADASASHGPVGPWLGPAATAAAPFAARVKRALDPEGRFPPLLGVPSTDVPASS